MALLKSPLCRRPVLLLTTLLLIVSSSLTAAVIHVPTDQPTIQAGIDAAVSGDTVLVADGLYIGPGNRDIIFGNKEITVRSEHGPETCVIDCQGSETEQRRGVLFQPGVGRNSVLQGFTIRGGDMGNYGDGGGIDCDGQASPTILDNIITGNRAYFGAGINIDSGSPLIVGNWIRINLAMNYAGSQGVGGGICCGGSPEIVGNVISGNVAGNMGGGICCFGNDDIQLVNNLIVWNRVDLLYGTNLAANGGGIGCLGCTVTVTNCTIAMNRVIDGTYESGYGGGLCHGPPMWKPQFQHTTVTVANSIIYGNMADFGDQCHVGHSMTGPCTLSLSYSDVEGGEAAVSNMNGILEWGTGMIEVDPVFASGLTGAWFLAQTEAGQLLDSPCLDAGNALASLVCYDDGKGTICLDQLTTRTDQVTDGGLVNMGYHYPPAKSVDVSLGCSPSFGTLPFPVTMEVELENRNLDQIRRMAARIDIYLAGGGAVSSWRAGYTNVAGGQSYLTSWPQNIPALSSLAGLNLFAIRAMDVTPPPWNQPPYPPAGDTASDNCTVTGYMP